MRNAINKNSSQKRNQATGESESTRNLLWTQSISLLVRHRIRMVAYRTWLRVAKSFRQHKVWIKIMKSTSLMSASTLKSLKKL